MEPSWPRRVFFGAIIFVVSFLALRFAQRKTFSGDFAGAWSAGPGPGPEGPVSDPVVSNEPHLSAPERAFSSLARVPHPPAMSGSMDFPEEGASEEQNNSDPLIENSAGYAPSAAVSAARAGTGAQIEVPSVESAAAADGKIPGVQRQAFAPSAAKSPARAAPNAGKQSAASLDSTGGFKTAEETAAARRSPDLGRASSINAREDSSSPGDNPPAATANGPIAKQAAPGAGPGRAAVSEVDSESAFQTAVASARSALSPASAPPPVSGRPVPMPLPLDGPKPPAENDPPLSGALSLAGGTEGPRRFATDKGKSAGVAVQKLPSGAIAFTADMDIVADGAGGHYKADKTGQAETALQYPGGGSLNPGDLPFIVVPLDFHKTYPEVQLGDFAAVSYNGRTVFAIIGDKGPTGVVGEGSIHLAKSLGINADPNRGGVESGVQYVILPGTRGRIPRESAEVQNQARELFRQRGLMP